MGTAWGGWEDILPEKIRDKEPRVIREGRTTIFIYNGPEEPSKYSVESMRQWLRVWWNGFVRRNIVDDYENLWPEERR